MSFCLYKLYSDRFALDGYEQALKTKAWIAVDHAREVVKGRFVDGEDLIKSDAHAAYLYAYEIIGGPWPEGEDLIATEAGPSYLYASYVLRGRFLKGEPSIDKSHMHSSWYSSIKDGSAYP